MINMWFTISNMLSYQCVGLQQHATCICKLPNCRFGYPGQSQKLQDLVQSCISLIHLAKSLIGADFAYPMWHQQAQLAGPILNKFVYFGCYLTNCHQFARVCLVNDHEFHHNIVKEAGDPLGCCLEDLQSTLIMFWHNINLVLQEQIFELSALPC